MASSIGKLTVDLTLASQRFEAGVKRVNAKMATMRRGFASATKSMGGMQARIAGLVGVAGFGALISNQLKTADSLAKMSDRLGIATEDLAAYRHLTELNGESSEGFEKSLTKMTRSIGEFQRGFGTGKKAFEDLGLSIEDLQNKNPAEQFQIIGDKIQGLGSKTLQASAAADIFGRTGINLLNTINQGTEGFEAARAEVEKYGTAISRLDAAKIEAANDAMERAKQSVEGVALKATVELAPIMETIAERFTESALAGEGFASKVKSAIRGVIDFVGVFADGIRGIKVILKAVEAGVVGFGSVWANVFNFLINDVLVPFANSITNLVLAPLREILEFGSGFSDTAGEMLKSIEHIGKAKGFDSIRNLASDMAANFEETKGELQGLMLETIPSEQMKEALDSVYAEAEEKALAVVEKVKEATENTIPAKPEEETQGSEKEDNPEAGNKKKEAAEKSHLDRMANIKIGSSKKVALVQKAIQLKTAVVDGFVAIQKAVASAPFPANIPAVALATTTTAANIAGIRAASFIGGGYIPDGARAGGVDDKGGRFAILHPDESIIDHKKTPKSAGDQGSVTVQVSPTFYGNDEEMVYQVLQRYPKKTARIVQSMMRLNT